jgi:hypothetical protein
MANPHNPARNLIHKVNKVLIFGGDYPATKVGKAGKNKVFISFNVEKIMSEKQLKRKHLLQPDACGIACL